jgi:hypothetical protein
MAGIFGDGQRGGIFGAKVDPRLLQMALEQRAEAERQRQGQARIAGAFDASQGMQEPSRALYEAKHQRAMDVLGNRPPEGPGFRDAIASLASLGPRAWGGAQKMWQAAPMAAEALYNDPLGSINSVGLAGQAATDAIVQGMVRPFTQFGDPNVDPVENAADLAMTVMGGSSVVPAEANSLRMGIKAYHGSPHDFERFDASKIGTGEGAQAYGHGLYLAENEGVARSYKPGANATYRANDVVKGHVASALKSAYKAGLSGQAAKKEALRYLQEYADNAGQSARRQEFHDAINNFDALSDLGHMYEVDIAADPEHFLDWDKPLSEQPEAVRKAFDEYGAGENVFPYEDKWIVKDPTHGWSFHNTQEEAIAASHGRLTGQDFHRALSQLGGDASTSELLKSKGVPGIRYLDQGSRVPNNNFTLISPKQGQIDEWTVINRQTGKHELFNDEAAARDYYDKQTSPTRNYVIFPGNEHLISILKKYGLPISAAGLAALSQLHPQEAQAAQRKPPAARK